MVILQFGFRKDDAIRVVPAFAAMSIATPVIAGLISFGERLHPLQVVGVVAILVGVLLITLESKAASMVESVQHGEASE
jgi:drug/metabolite transporter (DMT)-like permease